MTTWAVHIRVSVLVCTEVEADTEDEAHEKAEDVANFVDFSQGEIDGVAQVVSVEEEEA